MYYPCFCDFGLIKFAKNYIMNSYNLLIVSFIFTFNVSAQKNKNPITQTETPTEIPQIVMPTNPEVLISTPKGDIKVRLFNETPLHRDNFLKLVETGQYNGSIFHRVISGFMIQGGGKNQGTEDIGPQIQGEIYPFFHHRKGMLCAARTGDQINPSRKSSGSQFYVVSGRVFSEAELKALEAQKGIKMTAEQIRDYTTIGGAPHLDGAYTIFGEVIEGIGIIDEIANCSKSATRPEFPEPEIPMTMKVTKK